MTRRHRSPRVALVTAFDPHLYKGGIERFLLQLLDLLRDHGASVDVFCVDGKAPARGFRNRLYEEILDVGRRLREREADYDLALCNGFYGVGYFPRALPTYNIFHATHAAFAQAVRPFIAPVTYLEWSTMCGYLGEMSCGMYANRIAVSHEVARELSEHYGFDSARVVESGVDLDSFRPLADRAATRARLGIAAEAFVAIFVGRYDATKGADLLDQVVAATPAVTWLLVLGTGGQDCPLADCGNVHIVSEAAQDAMPALYRAADVLFFPSRYEGFGLVVIEAMACGLPVLTTPVGVARDLCRDELRDPCLLPDPVTDGAGVVAAAQCGIRALQAAPELRAELGARGRAAVQERFGLDRWRRDMAKALDLD